MRSHNWHPDLNKILETGERPTTWTQSLLITLLKKGNLQLCQNYRTINLISYPSKVMLKIMLNRLQPQTEEIISEEQACFRAGRNTKEQMLNLRILCGKYLPFNALIIPILRGCLQSLFNIPVPWYLFDTVLEVISWPAFVSRCILCSFDLPRVPFVNCRQFMYLVISLLVLRAGCGIWLYQFLIIANRFTLQQRQNLYHVFIDFKKAFDWVRH